MFRLGFFVYLLLNNYLVFNSCTPILPYEHALKSSALQNHALQKGSTVFDQASKKGVNSEQAVNGFSEDGAKKFEKAQSEGHFDKEDAVKKAHEQAANYADENFHKLQGGSSADLGKKNSYKKGHHKTGYHNSYHKDETGGNSSFYDDANDEGGEQYYKSNKGIYGDQAQKAQHGSHLDGSVYSNDAGQHGGYQKANDYGTQHNDARKYNQAQYYDDRNQQAVNNLGNQFNEHGIQQEQVYKAQVPVVGAYGGGIGGGYGGVAPGYGGYHNYYQQSYPVVAKAVPIPVPVHSAQTAYAEPKITVYEDPRYPYEQGSYYDDRIDYRPANYYYGKQPYDYYY